MLGQQVPGDAGIPLGTAERRGGQHPAEVAVTGRALDEDGDARTVRRQVRVLGRRGARGRRCRRGDDPQRTAPARREERLVGEHQLGTDERPQTGLARRRMQARRPIDAVDVRQRQGRKPQLHRLLDQVLRWRGALEEREGGGRMELGVGKGPGGGLHMLRLGVSWA